MRTDYTALGYREVYWRSNIHVLVVVTELYPNYGRKHFNLYNNGTWSNWSCNGQIINGSSETTTIPAADSVIISKMIVPAGTWIVNGSCQFTESFSQATVLTILNTGTASGVVRGTGANGGGLSTSVITSLSSSNTM